MRTYFQLTFFFLFLTASCDNYHSSTKDKKKPIIDIQPFAFTNDEDVKYVFAKLKERYDFIELKKSIPLPVLAYYLPRDRYRADSLIAFLARQTSEGHISIGLTNYDISTTKDKIPDWGVMGLAFQPGTACIASTHRLSKTLRQAQLFKVAIHELGHTQGLSHCSVKTCFMRDAESKNPTNEETDFCLTCKKKLNAKGLPL